MFLPCRFVKFVSREVPRVELLLKLVSTPKDRFADRCCVRFPTTAPWLFFQTHCVGCRFTSVKALWPDVSATELTRVMELKNMKSSEQRETLESLGLAAAGAGSSGVPSMRGLANMLGAAATFTGKKK